MCIIAVSKRRPLAASSLSLLPPLHRMVGKSQAFALSLATAKSHVGFNRMTAKSDVAASKIKFASFPNTEANSEHTRFAPNITGCKSSNFSPNFEHTSGAILNMTLLFAIMGTCVRHVHGKSDPPLSQQPNIPNFKIIVLGMPHNTIYTKLSRIYLRTVSLLFPLQLKDAAPWMLDCKQHPLDWL